VIEKKRCNFKLTNKIKCKYGSFIKSLGGIYSFKIQMFIKLKTINMLLPKEDLN
jgi:hypothetical protein